MTKVPEINLGKIATSFGMQIKVTPEVMDELAGELEQKISAAKESYENMKSKMQATSSYWVGEGGDVFRNKFHSGEEKMEEIFRRFQEHVTDLRTMAGNYRNAEVEAMEMPSMLPSDVIE